MKRKQENDNLYTKKCLEEEKRRKKEMERRKKKREDREKRDKAIEQRKLDVYISKKEEVKSLK
jgi:hypothetical protein